jgi:hypothetical protein
MIKRRVRQIVEEALDRQAAVALMGPRQVGKTTLALDIAEARGALYLDLESREDRAKLEEPALFLRNYADRLVILDEIHRMPDIFQVLRGLIDQGRRQGRRTGRFLILGSASIDLLRQSGESLAGRIEYINMGPLDALEVVAEAEAEASASAKTRAKSTAKTTIKTTKAASSEAQQQAVLNRLWVRGGFPDSYLAKSDPDSMKLRRSFIRTYLERDVAQFGPRIPAETLDRLWTMLAHNQGTLLNASKLAAALSISAPTVTSYIDLLVDLLLLRRLRPYHGNTGKRLVKSPRVFVRDSGLLHALLGIGDLSDLFGHPVVGASWEGFVIENLIAAAPEQTIASFYRTAAGAEIDLILELPGNNGLWAIEIKRSLSAKPEKGFYFACQDVEPERRFVVYPGQDTYPVGNNVQAIGITALCSILAAI